MKITIIGCGNIGTLIAGQLSKKGIKSLFILKVKRLE